MKLSVIPFEDIYSTDHSKSLILLDIAEINIAEISDL